MVVSQWGGGRKLLARAGRRVDEHDYSPAVFPARFLLREGAMARVYTVRPRVSLLLLGLSLCIAWQIQGASGGAAAAAMPSQKAPSMTLRGGSDAAPAAQQEAETAEAQKAMQEQLDYWNSLTKEQQDELLANMSPEERANAEGICKTVCHTQTRPVLLRGTGNCAATLWTHLLEKSSSVCRWEADEDDNNRRVSKVRLHPIRPALL